MARATRITEIEAVPEADCLEGFPHPRMATKLFGHAEAERMLAAAFGADRLHHAWLLAGDEGIGKATLAYRFARFVLSEQDERAGDGSLDVATGARGLRQIRSMSHPGLLVIRRPYDFKEKRFKASITIDEVRRLRDFLGHTSGNGSWRVVIVDPVDDLNINAANALLKSLEEPPPRCVFLLVSHEPGRLLPTIRSRCRHLALQPLDDAQVEAAARQALESGEVVAPDAAAWPRLMPLAQGSVRRLLSLASREGDALSQQVDRVLGEAGRVVDWAAAHRLAEEIGSPAALQKFETFFELLCLRLAGKIRMCAAQDPHEAGAVVKVAGLVEPRLASWAELWETIVREKADVLALNLDRRSFVLETVARLDAVARG